MNFFRQRYHSWLVPYVEGTLDARRRRTLEARLARDPQLAAEAEAQRRMTHHLRGAASSQPVEEAPQADSVLWQRVQARIEPQRRAASKPAVWAGSACVLAGLAWAALWGPLGHLAAPRPIPTRPSQVALTPPQDSPTLDETGGHHRRHLRRKAHRASDLLARRAGPIRPSALRREDTPTTSDDRRLAVNEPPPPTVPDAAPSMPEGTHSGAGGQFRLATHTHPMGREEEGSAPKTDTSASETADGTATEAGSRDTPALPTAKEVVGMGNSPAQTPKGHRQRRRHHRHHRRAVSPATPAPESAPAAQAPTGPPASDAPVSASPRRPKPLPID